MATYKFTDIEETINPEDVDLKSFEPKTELQSDIWDSDDRINQIVRRKLLSIARDFIKGLDEIDEIDIEDVIFTGSLANYNWNEEHSDIDLHIVVDLKALSNNEKINKGYFDAIRKNWNERHEDISIFGYPIEMYVQDKNEPHTSSGIYSLLRDEWIKKPKKGDMEMSDEDSIKDKVAYYTNRVEELEDKMRKSRMQDDVLMDVYMECEKLMDEIKEMRKSGFADGGDEMNPGNLTFKSLRREGVIERITNMKRLSYDFMNSIN